MVCDKSPLLLHVFPTFAVGGSQRRFSQLVAAFGKRYRHSVLALDGNYSMGQLLPSTAPVSLLDPPWHKRSSIAMAVSALRRWAPDILLTYNWGSFDWWAAQRLLGIRHVHIEDGFGPEEQTKRLRRRNLARRITLSHPSTKVVLPSKTLFNIAAEEWGLCLRSLHYIPNGIDIERFSCAKPMRANPSVVLGTLATLRPEKNIPRLISLFERCAAQSTNNCLELRIIGGGPALESIEQIVSRSRYAERIVLAGPSDKPESALTSLDIFALTSTTEQMPLSVLEAMASGLPIVAFDAGDTRSMLAHANRSFVFQQDDDAGFINAVLALTADSNLRTRLGAANRDTVKAQFDIRKMVEAYAALLV